MSQQELGLRRSTQILRRHKKMFGAITLLGLLIGVAHALITPPMISSSALVVVPETAAQQTQVGASGSDVIVAEEEVVATSTAILLGALPNISPAPSLATLKSRISVSTPAVGILSFNGDGKTAAQAESIANAVANSYVAYVGSSSSPVGHIEAKVLEPASTASASKVHEQMAIYGALGAVAGALIGYFVTLAIGRKDRRLVGRAAIANSIAAPVLASIAAQRPSDAAHWARLLEEYEPEAVDAWGINKLLQRFGIAGNRTNGFAGSQTQPFSLTVFSLSGDVGALALGPQLAAFAATLGIPTALVVGPQQDTNTAAALRTACAAPQPGSGRRKPLRVIAAEDGRRGQIDTAFVVVVMVVDGKDPRIPDMDRTTMAVLGVSAGGATAPDLARVATAAAADGPGIVGILVANPDPDDQTSGQVPRLSPLRRPMPTRLHAVPMEIRR
jgi:capsular polysaccharide biosynthesis protein